jgi:hypothetical protein
MKRGAYNKSVVTVDGETITGLKRRPSRGRFYATDDPNSTFGDDPVAAFVRFAQWRWEQKRGKLSRTEVRKLPVWFSEFSDVCPEIAKVLRNVCRRLDIDDLASALGIRRAGLRRMAVESVKQMSIFELADLIGIDWTRLRQAAIEQAADDQSSVSRMPTELKETVENYQRDGFLLPDDFGIKLDA